MLGEQVAEFAGQIISTRILEDLGTGSRTEATDHTVGTLCGLHAEGTVTYVSTMRPNGTIAGSGNGIVVTANGHTATFRGTGVGRMTAPGTVSYRGAIFYETSAQELSRLNGIAVVFEYEVVDGKSVSNQFEWK
jgi:hypothetical protein